MTIGDTESGLASIVPVTLVNATLDIPPSTVGTTSPVVVTATKINQSIASTVVLRATDVAGNSTVCDPVYTTLSADIPQEFVLASNYPNPFNPTTSINFGISQSFAGGVVSLKTTTCSARKSGHSSMTPCSRESIQSSGMQRMITASACRAVCTCIG